MQRALRHVDVVDRPIWDAAAAEVRRKFPTLGGVIGQIIDLAEDVFAREMAELRAAPGAAEVDVEVMHRGAQLTAELCIMRLCLSFSAGLVTPTKKGAAKLRLVGGSS